MESFRFPPQKLSFVYNLATAALNGESKTADGTTTSGSEQFYQHRYFLVSGILFLFIVLYVELVTITASIAQVLDFLDDGRWCSSLAKYVPLSKMIIIGALLLIAIVFAAYATIRND